MKIVFNSTSLSKTRTDLVVLPVSAREGKQEKTKKKSKVSKSLWQMFEPSVVPLLKELDVVTGGFLAQQLSSSEFKALKARRSEIAVPGQASPMKHIRIAALSSLSAADGASLDEWRRLGGDSARAAKRLKAASLTITLAHLKRDTLLQAAPAIVEGAILANYEFTKFKGKKPDVAAKQLSSLNFHLSGPVPAALKQAIQVSSVAAQSVLFARDLVNTPPSDLLPVTLVRHARELTKKSGLKIKIFDRKALQKMKAGALLGVSRGSSSEPYLIHLSYVPRTKSRGQKRVTLIGKGITFDSGGLSIKTGKGMEDMKCDMAGAACVLAVGRALTLLPKEARVKHEVHLLVPTCENMVSGLSVKPGDVLRAMNGKTIEVLNTDAEGRLILADALCYSEKLDSDLTVDLATLTGACIVALGTDYAGLFANDEALQKGLEESFGAAGEKLWPLPLAEEYRSQLESDTADLRNIGTGGPGAILGALFLKEFVPASTAWAHLDIAGPAFIAKGHEYAHRGGTGYGVMSLLRFLQTLA